MSRIDTHFSPLLRIVKQHNQEIGRSLERLSTGLRINRASDDPSGLIASERLGANSQSIAVSIENAQRAYHVINIAEGGLSQITELLIEAQSLIVASVNEAGLTDEEKQANQGQIESIFEAIDHISNSTTFQGKKLLDGTYRGASFQIGPDIESGRVGVSITAVTSRSLGLDALRTVAGISLIDADRQTRERITTQASRIASLAGGRDDDAYTLYTATASLLDEHEGDVDVAITTLTDPQESLNSRPSYATRRLLNLVDGDRDKAAQAVQHVADFIALSGGEARQARGIFAKAIKLGQADLIDGDLELAQDIITHALAQVTGQRARLGALQKNTIGPALANLQVALENTLAAQSAIRDTDFAEEIINLTRNQILAAAGQEAIKIAQAQSVQVLKLL